MWIYIKSDVYGSLAKSGVCGMYAFTLITGLQHSSTIQLVEKVKDTGSASPLEYTHACFTHTKILC